MAIPHSPLLAFDRFGFRHRLPLFAAKCGVGKKGRIKYCRSNWSSQNETGCSRKRSNVRKHVDPGAPHHYRDLSLASNSSGSLPRPVVSSYFRQVDETKWGRAREKKKKKETFKCGSERMPSLRPQRVSRILCDREPLSRTPVLVKS